MLKYILLGFLRDSAKTGYQLKALMDQSTGHFWHAYHSQIYTTLRALERDGLVQSDEDAAGEDKLNRRVYHLTGAGLAALAGHREIKITLRYAHLAPSHLRAGIQVLEQRRVEAAGPELSPETPVTPVSRDLGGSRKWWSQRDSNPCLSLERAPS